MIDFLLRISRNAYPGFNETEISGKQDFSKGLNFSSSAIEGENFSFKVLRHTYEPTDDLCREGQKYVAVFGDVFSRKDSAIHTAGPERLSAKDLLLLYMREGNTFINKLKGSYIILVLDEENSEYNIVSSRTGLLDAYYYKGPDFLLLSTSPESITRYPGLNIEIDAISLLQQSIFDYPLGERTLFRNVCPLAPSTLLSYDLSKVTETRYAELKELVTRNPELTWKQTHAETPRQFNRALDLIIKGQGKLLASLTSGFDSRTNLSRLAVTKQNEDVLYYSWGMPGSVEIQVPEMISRRTKIQYRPVYLDQSFEDQYDYFGKQAVVWSGGKGTIRRANHTYGYSLLFGHSPTVVTGLFGSELLRPANSVGHIFNQAFVDVFFSHDKESRLKSLFDKLAERKSFKPGFLEANRTAFLTETTAYFKKFRDIGDRHQQLYYFSLQEGFRKYFGHEINGCRQYVKIISPYIDDDFVEFLFRTPVPTLNQKAFKRDPRSLKRGQSFYLPVMRKNYRALLDMPTGRFYTPRQLTSFFFPLNIIPAYLKHRKRRKNDDTFNTVKWNMIFAERNPSLMDYQDDIFNPLSETRHLLTPNEFAGQVSTRFWLNYSMPGK